MKFILIALLATVCRGGSTRGAIGGIKPPYLPNTHGYPPKPPFIFEMKQ